MNAFWTALLTAIAALAPSLAKLLGHDPAPEPPAPVAPGFGAQEARARATAAQRAKESP